MQIRSSLRTRFLSCGAGVIVESEQSTTLRVFQSPKRNSSQHQ